MARSISSGSFVDSIVTGMTFLIYCVVSVIWAVVGFILWVPLLVRVVFTFTASVVMEAVSGDDRYTGAIEIN
jgi:hypothetical protein